MPKVVEFRVPLPLRTEEFKTALPYVVTRCSEELSLKGTGDKVDVLTSEPFDDGKLKGQFTHKVFHVSRRLPEWIKTFVPALRGTTLEEKSWNAFPYCKTVYECKLLGDRFKMEVLSMHLDNDTGQADNALDLPEDLLKIRKVKRINIRDVESVQGVPLPRDFVPKTEKAANRGPLPEGWLLEKKDDSRRPVMCAYKVVKLEVKIWPVQEQCEQFMVASQIEKGITEVCVRAWTWLDDYIDFDEEALREYERESIRRLELALNPEKREEKKNADVEKEEGEGDAIEEKKAGHERADGGDGGGAGEKRPRETRTASGNGQRDRRHRSHSQARQHRGRRGGMRYDGNGDDATPTCKIMPELSLPSIRFPNISFPPLPEKLSSIKDLVDYLKFGSPFSSMSSSSSSSSSSGRRGSVGNIRDQDDASAANSGPERLQLPPSRPPLPATLEQSSNSCKECATLFGLFTRRFNCRGCGKAMCSNCNYIERELSQFAEYYGPAAQRICSACDQKQADLEDKHVKKMRRRRRSQSPKEMQLRRAIRERARELATEGKKAAPSSHDGLPQSSRLVKIMVFFTTVLFAILAVAATKPNSRLGAWFHSFLTLQHDLS